MVAVRHKQGALASLENRPVSEGNVAECAYIPTDSVPALPSEVSWWAITWNRRLQTGMGQFHLCVRPAGWRVSK